MMNETARCLIAARRAASTVNVGEACPPDVATAYAVQDLVAADFGWFEGAAPRYWKSGGASRDALLTHAPLPPAGVWHSPAQAQDWPFAMRGIEAEIALRLAHDVDRERALSLDGAQANAFIDAMCVSIEIVDSRWKEGFKAPGLAMLADQLLHGALVLGEWVPFEARNWSDQLCRVHIGARPVVERVGDYSLADPAYLLPAWLQHATRHGDCIAAGTVVTTGSWIGMLSADAGDLVHAEFPGIGSASVQL